MQNLSKREIGELYGGSGMQYRSQNMWSGFSHNEKANTMKIEISNNERENAEQINALAKAHGQEDFGARAIATNMSFEVFKRALLDEISNEPFSYGGEMPRENYSLARAIKGVALGNLDGEEAEFHQEQERKRGKLGDGKVYTRALTASNSSFMNSSYSQNVISSMKSSGLYRELGCRVENIPDGKYVYPRESAFGATAMYDLNNSNNISAGDPTLDSVTLEAKQLAGLTILARNLLAQESVNLESYLQDSLVNSMNRTLDAQILVGSGSGANFNGAVNSAGNAETYSGSMAFADLLGAINKVQADGINVSGCAFVFHPDEYQTFVNADRGTNTGNYVINPELMSGSHMVGRTLGIPVYVNDQMTSGQAVFGDFSRSVVGFHGGGAIVEVDPFYDFQKGSVAIRLIEDVSFGLLNPNAFCSIKSS